MKTGVIDVGGGMRGIYADDVLDTCLKQNAEFDYCIGISAGSANMASYLAKQPERNYVFYHEYSFQKTVYGYEKMAKNRIIYQF